MLLSDPCHSHWLPGLPTQGQALVLHHSFVRTPTLVEEVAMPLCFCFRSQNTMEGRSFIRCFLPVKKVGLMGCHGDLRASSRLNSMCQTLYRWTNWGPEGGRGSSNSVRRARAGSQGSQLLPLPSGCKGEPAIWLVFFSC